MFNTPYSQNSNATVPTAAVSGEEQYQQYEYGDGFNFVADDPIQEDTSAFIVPQQQNVAQAHYEEQSYHQ